MRVPVKLLGFVVWLLFLKCGQCKDCLRDDIKYENVEPVLEASYDDGKTVIVTCHTGFTGMYKLRCEDGKWRENIARPCEKKKCGHPGDTANGNFIISVGIEYVFGTTVVYTCQEGYEMTSRINHRTCRSQGWDNAVPVCEAKQEECPDIYVENGFSQPLNKTVILYSCNKGYKPFTGEWWSLVTCVKGSWSDVPLCIREEECGALPSVQNGKLKLKDQESAEVDCDPGFISNPPSIKCIRGIWETPTCNESVRCGIPPKVINSVITSKPEVVYIHGSSISYICRSPFVMIGKSTVFCSNGKWEETPTCEARCLRPLENYMALANDKDTYQDKEILNYQCLKPYDKIPEGEWICENGKWTGNFVCTSDICPPPPYIENGSHFSRNPDEKIPTEVYYECQAYYVLSERKQYYRCENGRWRTPPKCLKPCQITQDILEAHNMRPDQQTGYIKHGDYVDYYCQHGLTVWTGHYKKVTCSDGRLGIESCQ